MTIDEARRDIDERIIKVMTNALDDLVGECLDGDGKIVAPSKKALMKARAMLPPRCKNTLVKVRHDKT